MNTKYFYPSSIVFWLLTLLVFITIQSYSAYNQYDKQLLEHKKSMEKIEGNNSLTDGFKRTLATQATPYKPFSSNFWASVIGTSMGIVTKLLFYTYLIFVAYDLFNGYRVRLFFNPKNLPKEEKQEYKRLYRFDLTLFFAIVLTLYLVL